MPRLDMAQYALLRVMTLHFCNLFRVNVTLCTFMI